jgi:glycosyltransferase involved in cell wall biosynthesis
MRVLLLPDPVLVQAPGSLRTQVMETCAALRALPGDFGIEAELALAPPATYAGLDVVHAFGAGGANAGAIAAAAANGAALVLSPRLSPGWNRSNGSRARVGDRALGGVGEPALDSGYAQIRRALDTARVVVAHGAAEAGAISEAFLQPPAKVALVAHGVAARFFNAAPALFRERVRVSGRFALMVGQVAPWNNQLGVARALAGLALPLVVVGEACERDAAYQRELCRLRTVRCLGPLAHDDPLLASAYAAASVFVLASRGGHAPMAAAEALAAGTAVVGEVGAIPSDVPAAAAVAVDCNDAAALQGAVSNLLEYPPERDAVRRTFGRHTWDAVARQLTDCYRTAVEAGYAGSR